MLSTEMKVQTVHVEFLCSSVKLTSAIPEYGFPMDESFLDRYDLCHAKYYALLDKKRFLAPIDSHPQCVLDLGCGTGD